MTADPLLQLLLDEGHLPADRLEEVLERRVLSGGNLETALLELGLLDEVKALELLGRVHHWPTADRARLLHPTPESIAVLPRRIAERHGLCPVELSGRKLVIAARAPDDVTAFESLLEELGFALSLYLKPMLTTEPRLWWALHRTYQLPIPERLTALLDQWDGDFDVDVEESGPTDKSGWRSLSWPGIGEEVTAPLFPSLGEEDSSGWTIPAPGSVVLPTTTDTRPSAPALSLIVDGTVAAPDPARVKLLAHLEKLETEERTRDERRKTKVMWTVDDALAELALAQTRDELLEVALRFAWRRLKTAAVVVRQGKSLVVFDVLDPLLRGNELRRFPLPYGGEGADAAAFDGDHALARAVRLRSPVLGPVDDQDPFVRLLGRRPRAVLIIPILIGDRCVGAMVGDNGDRAVPPTALAELHMVVPRLGRALGNLVLRARRSAAGLPATGLAATGLAATGLAAAGLAGAGLAGAGLAGTGIGSDDLARTGLVEPAAVDVESAPEPPRPAPSILLEEGEEDVVLDDHALRDLAHPASGRAAAAPSTMVRLPAAAAKPGHFVEIGDDDVAAAADEITIAPSPGASARESLLVATWRAWLAQAVVSADDDLDELITALAVDGDAARAAVQRLQNAGPRALLALARAFPGVLPAHPFEGPAAPLPGRSGPGVVDALPTPYFQALSRLGADAIAPILVGNLDHDDRLHRWGAVVGLAVVDVPAALPRLAQRAFDPEQRLASLAVDVLSRQRHNPQFPAVMARLRDLCRRGDDFERLRAVRAVAALKDGGAIGVLIDLLATRPREIADEARAALVEITVQDFGTAERRWRAWLADHGGLPRRTWLIDSLSHKDVALRRMATDELRDDGVALFSYRPEASQKERETALVAINQALRVSPA